MARSRSATFRWTWPMRVSGGRGLVMAGLRSGCCPKIVGQRRAQKGYLRTGSCANAGGDAGEAPRGSARVPGQARGTFPARGQRTGLSSGGSRRAGPCRGGTSQAPQRDRLRGIADQPCDRGPRGPGCSASACQASVRPVQRGAQEPRLAQDFDPAQRLRAQRLGGIGQSARVGGVVDIAQKVQRLGSARRLPASGPGRARRRSPAQRRPSAPDTRARSSAGPHGGQGGPVDAAPQRVGAQRHQTRATAGPSGGPAAPVPAPSLIVADARPRPPPARWPPARPSTAPRSTSSTSLAAGIGHRAARDAGHVADRGQGDRHLADQHLRQGAGGGIDRHRRRRRAACAR